MERPLNQDELKDMLINPYYVGVLNEDLFTITEQDVAEEDWIKECLDRIDMLGVDIFIIHFLQVTVEDQKPPAPMVEAITSPARVVHVSPSLRGPHEKIVDVGLWYKSNTNLMNELGPEEWLRRVLRVLQTDD